MGDTHAAGSDPHMAHTAVLFGPHSTIEGIHMDHEFNPNDYENTAHHSLSPFQMNMPSTLSRPPSMASMSNFALPPVQPPLSRVGSLSNFNFQPMTQNLFFQTPLNGMTHPGFFTPSYIPQQHQQPGQQSSQQQSPNQLINFPIVGSAEFRMFQAPDFPGMTPAAPPSASKSKDSTKTTKKPRGKRNAIEIPPPPAHELPPAKLVKVEKPVVKAKKAQVEDVKPQRSRNPSSIYRGVSKCSKDGRWQARIRVKRQVTYLGRFVKEEDAARKYDEAARIHHGDKAVLNFPTEEDKQLGRKQATSVMGGEDDDDDSDA